eukprot:TRINITY_DN17719_c0_g1_i1.p1 TRINITY_DN17719_c0_g1~~TRINITY_DN17719_c0_g1_i1.p1  ORF type:complete len:146 (+),score=42.16 TRINITY_DN17719_c0_g1_i1:92-529(+)
MGDSCGRFWQAVFSMVKQPAKRLGAGAEKGNAKKNEDAELFNDESVDVSGPLVHLRSHRLGDDNSNNAKKKKEEEKEAGKQKTYQGDAEADSSSVIKQPPEPTKTFSRTTTDVNERTARFISAFHSQNKAESNDSDLEASPPPSP